MKSKIFIANGQLQEATRSTQWNRAAILWAQTLKENELGEGEIKNNAERRGGGEDRVGKKSADVGVRKVRSWIA